MCFPGIFWSVGILFAPKFIVASLLFIYGLHLPRHITLITSGEIASMCSLLLVILEAISVLILAECMDCFGDSAGVDRYGSAEGRHDVSGERGRGQRVLVSRGV